MDDEFLLSLDPETKIIHRRYIVTHRLGEGAFGKIYQGYHQKTNENVAIKVSPAQTKYSLICNEAKILNYLYAQGCRSIPILYWYGTVQTKFTCMIIPFYKTCLFEARNKKSFSLEQIHNIAIQAIDIFEEIHNKYIIHRDIKPQNFMIDRGQLILIDFGLATFYINSENQHNPIETDHYDITGSPKYISPNIHQGMTASRRDDLISFGYVLLFLLLGKLEWDDVPLSPSLAYQIDQKMYEKTHTQHYKNKIRFERKKYENIESWCTSNVVLNYIKYGYSLKYDETPYYELCKELFYFQNNIESKCVHTS